MIKWGTNDIIEIIQPKPFGERSAWVNFPVDSAEQFMPSWWIVEMPIHPSKLPPLQ